MKYRKTIALYSRSTVKLRDERYSTGLENDKPRREQDSDKGPCEADLQKNGSFNRTKCPRP